MKSKKLIALSLSAAMLSSAAAMLAGGAALADDEPIKVLVNGSPVTFTEADPFIENEHTLVPLRAIFEALGAQVNWDGETRTVVSYDPVSDVSIIMQIDQALMFVGENRVELETPARIVNDRTVVPVRAIAEGMNSVVGWDDKTRTVTVTKDITLPNATEAPKATEAPGEETPDATKAPGEETPDATKAPDEETPNATGAPDTAGTSDEETAAQIANPWTDYESLEELNAAIDGYDISLLTGNSLTPKAYRYLADNSLAEIQYDYSTKRKSAEVIVRKMPGDSDISGISGGKSSGTYKTKGGLAAIYKLDNITYAVVSFETDAVYSNSVSVQSDDLSATEAKNLVKSYVDEIAKLYN